jgi:hypothetical protein
VVERTPGSQWAVDDPAALSAVHALFEGSPVAMAAFGWTCGVLAGLGPATVRLTSSQMAFRRRVGFAWLWPPPAWLGARGAPVVLSIGARARVDSQRWKQVVEPYPGRWMHHLEVREVAELDEEVAGWLAVAYEQAGPVGPGEDPAAAHRA